MSISGNNSRIGSSRSLEVIRNSSSGSIRPDNKAPEFNLNQIYGRENESKIIQGHIDKLSTGTIVVKGLSGSGKSSLIESQNFEEDGWVYAKGKYEGRRKQEPYSALIDALDSLVDQWMINNNNADVCKLSAFNVLLYEDLVLLENILPHLFHDIKAKKLKSKECPLPSSGIRSEAKSDAQVGAGAVNAAFWRIMSFFCEAKPVVLFLDDIQWADQASLDAIQVLSSAGNIEGFLLILSYREEEVKEGDSVVKCLDFIKEEGERVETIHVTNLDVENTNKMVSCLFGQESERTLELTKVIHSKTAGNPFFVFQFIQMLRHEYFLKYNFLTLEWEWGNVHKMDQLAYVSDNVADVIAASMSKLPHDCLLALQNASCLGKVIPMQVLAKYLRKYVTKEYNICDTLKGIKVKGLKEVFRDAVKFGILTQVDDETFMWAHDKLQYVAYSMISPECRQMCHKSLGMVLWEMHKSNPENEWMLYMAADQLNHLTDVTDDGLSEDIARLSFQAGQLSISKAAFFPALDMIRFAAKHLGNMKDSWETAYELSLDVYNTLAEMSMRFASSEEALDAAIQVDRHANTLEDKIRAQIIFVRYKVEGSNRDYLGGIESIRNILLDYGVKFPTKIIPGQQFLQNRRLKAHLEGKVEVFLTLPKLDERNIDEKRTQIILNLLSYVLECTHFDKKLKDLHFYATTRILNISMKEGCTSDTALAIVRFGSLGHAKDSKEWGEVATKLVDSFPRKIGSRHAAIHTWVAFGLLAASVPLYKLLDPILELNRYSLKHGDITGGIMAWIGYSYTYISVGLPLEPLDSDTISFSKEALQFGIPETIRVLMPIFRQTIHNLKVFQPIPTLLKGDIFDQEKELKKFKNAGLKMTLRDINSFRLMLACVYQDWEAAEELISALEPFLYTDKWVLRRHVYLVFMGYASVALGETTKRKKGHRFRQLGKKIIKIFKDKLKNGSADALPIIMMLQAIESPSKKRFDEAIRTTARLGLVHYSAILYENSGLFFMEESKMGWAKYYLAEATKLYGEWGAHGKAMQMLDKYEFLHSSSLDQNYSVGNIHGRTRFSSETFAQMREPITSSLTGRASLTGHANSYDEKE